jgi:glycine hydroxymethyltransferase
LIVEVLSNTQPEGTSKAKYRLADGTAERVHAGAGELLAVNPLYPGLTV